VSGKDETNFCQGCKDAQKKIEDLEGALAGAQNIVRTLRDAASTMKEKA
jgi:hypothetical protein